MPELPAVIVVVEGNSDVRVVRGFAERALLEVAPDFTPELLEWRGLDDGTPFVRWSGVLEEIRKRRIVRRYGHFEGAVSEDAAKIYAHQARNALTLCHACGLPLAVVLVCDADSQPERLEGLKQARADHESFYKPEYPIVVGVADPCREAWVLCGFEPRDHEQPALLEKIRELTFDPTRAAHKLNTSNSPRHAKRVLEFLTNGDLYREELCWSKAEFLTLHSSGLECGLQAYLEEVQQRLVVLFGAK